MSNRRRIMWNGTVRALPLQEQIRATVIAGCEVLTVTPSDYVKWLSTSVSTRDIKSMAADAGIRITHLDPFVRWIENWKPDLPPETFPTNSIAFDADDFFRMAGVLEVESFTAWAGFPAGRYKLPQMIDAFGALCERAATEGLRCDLEFIPVFGIPDLQTGWAIIDGVSAQNSGIVLDMWHYMRGGRDDALLGLIPGDKITAVQLCDATTEAPAGMSLAEDGLNNRRAPGDGDFPGLEIFSPCFDIMSAEAIGETSRSILDKLLGSEGKAS